MTGRHISFSQKAWFLFLTYSPETISDLNKNRNTLRIYSGSKTKKSLEFAHLEVWMQVYLLVMKSLHYMLFHSNIKIFDVFYILLITFLIIIHHYTYDRV